MSNFFSLFIFFRSFFSSFWNSLSNFLNFIFSFGNARPSSNSFSSGMKGGDLVELKSYVSLVEFFKSGFKKKNVLQRRFLTNFSVLLISALMYCFSLHMGMFLAEYPKLNCSNGCWYKCLYLDLGPDRFPYCVESAQQICWSYSRLSAIFFAQKIALSLSIYLSIYLSINLSISSPITLTNNSC